MPVGPVSLERLTDDPIVIALSVLPRFTEAEEAILDARVDESEIQIKPTGQIYLPHPGYIKWLNRAFGRGQWWLMQLSKPQRANNSVLVNYAFVLRGLACYSTYGEADYHENNREQTFGDVIESTHAYALRRFAKRLGIGLELWDRSYGDQWIDKFAVCVYVTNKEGKSVRQWRRRDAPPLKYEQGKARTNDDQTEQAQRQQTRRRPQAQPERTVAPHPKGDAKVSNAQLIRFWTIARGRGRSDDEVKHFLKTHYNLDSSRDMTRKDYENITKAVEHPGPLRPVLDIKPEADGRWMRDSTEREPGSDDN